MKTLGYYYDQVSREVMTQKISAKVKLVDASTPTTAQLGRTDTAWVEVQHPVDHELDVTWAIDGTTVAEHQQRAQRSTSRPRRWPAGTHTLTATVVDPTTFVRDPAIRNGTALTQKLTWTIKDGVNDPVAAIAGDHVLDADRPRGRPQRRRLRRDVAPVRRARRRSTGRSTARRSPTRPTAATSRSRR